MRTKISVRKAASAFPASQRRHSLPSTSIASRRRAPAPDDHHDGTITIAAPTAISTYISPFEPSSLGRGRRRPLGGAERHRHGA